MGRFMADIVMIVSQVYTSFQTHQAVYINYVEYFAVQKEKRKRRNKNSIEVYGTSDVHSC